MTRFDLNNLRAFAQEGIARHGLRGYARKLDLDLGTLRSLRDGRDIQSSRMIGIVEAMGRTLLISDAPDGPRARAGGFGEASKDGEEPPEALRQGYLPIPYHPAQRTYGASAPVAFTRAWLDERGFAPENLCCVQAPDDTLAPGIAKGALCLIDGAERQVSGHVIWAHLEEGQLRLNYLSQPEPGMMLMSDADPTTPPVLRRGPELDQLLLLGRVVWAGALAG
ncbi:hypothetical protein MNBD_ALPHA07-1062 [hydrothermal vent metagenome]|uniref:Peptidase S24/S26A/S26B/S26C domain-containing protein n=1 Tax=hydrothermal vent metagenome TaxID=652676 RepID=A0A3B0RY47_9ZZZZ